MQITYQKALAIEELITKYSRESLPFKTSYKLAKIQQALHEELSILNNSLKQTIQKWATKDNQGNLVTNEEYNICVPDNKIDNCLREMREIITTNIIIPSDISLSVKELEECNFTIKEIQILLPLIKEN